MVGKWEMENGLGADPTPLPPSHIPANIPIELAARQIPAITLLALCFGLPFEVPIFGASSFFFFFFAFSKARPWQRTISVF